MTGTLGNMQLDIGTHEARALSIGNFLALQCATEVLVRRDVEVSSLGTIGGGRPVLTTRQRGTEIRSFPGFSGFALGRTRDGPSGDQAQ
ncbi:MAG: hypothetical protein CM1200mP36_00650 [Gammaproteobacteria bacterium]|nr:MAG: hypothetical protein CM1200mP36_00650 [Gammaproteobacteria bacterium]